ncbi:hypothetical protein NGM10_01150 [Halorussus salilacus]|uniref:hypothetical protein n=1 Tax=Halorussus salilacus TaxID=2953750 RepID=UPI00209CCA55|nr:hypothetical protein [Halorussus salilacus]USZ68361.1 hypothetical protein NGM10_01150 [Halorussus salilacus]
MTSGADERAGETGIASTVGAIANTRLFASLFAGLLVGSGFSLLGTSAVAVPAVGSVSGTPVGVAGIVVGVLVYLRAGRCENCNGTFGLGRGCDCDGDCGDGRSVDP